MYGTHSTDPEPADSSVSDLPLDPTSPERTVTLRDDRLDFSGLMDAAASCRRRGARLRLVDEGGLTVSELEWLGEAGADVYSSDKARSDGAALVLIRKATRRGGAAAVFFHHGPFADPSAADGLAYEILRELGRSGIDLHVSDKIQTRDAAQLSELAYDCDRGGAAFVLYHHGPLEAWHEELASQGVWIHLSSRGVAVEDNVRAIADCARAAQGARAGLILHVENPIDPQALSDIVAAGTILLFKTPPSDYRSPLRPFEDAAKAVRLDPRAYYLFTDFVL
jgi:hypothetical protein